MITRRRAALAVAASVLVPPAVVGLARAGWWPGALVLAGLFAVYVGIELGSWVRRERRRRAAERAFLTLRGAVLRGVTYSREDVA